MSTLFLAAAIIAILRRAGIVHNGKPRRPRARPIRVAEVPVAWRHGAGSRVVLRRDVVRSARDLVAIRLHRYPERGVSSPSSVLHRLGE